MVVWTFSGEIKPQLDFESSLMGSFYPGSKRGNNREFWWQGSNEAKGRKKAVMREGAGIGGASSGRYAGGGHSERTCWTGKAF